MLLPLSWNRRIAKRKKIQDPRKALRQCRAQGRLRRTLPKRFEPKQLAPSGPATPFGAKGIPLPPFEDSPSPTLPEKTPRPLDVSGLFLPLSLWPVRPEAANRPSEDNTGPVPVFSMSSHKAQHRGGGERANFAWPREGLRFFLAPAPGELRIRLLSVAAAELHEDFNDSRDSGAGGSRGVPRGKRGNANGARRGGDRPGLPTAI
jgi:hypothetical protein